MGTVRVTAVRTAKRTSSNMVSNLYTFVKVWSNSASTLSGEKKKFMHKMSWKLWKSKLLVRERLKYKCQYHIFQIYKGHLQDCLDY